nr:Hpt domain-containing protein [Thalassotalea sp. G2M2-11]
MFYEDHGKDGEHIEQALKANDLERLKHLVHTLKGVACSISANTLFEAAKSFDLAINEQRTQQYHELFAELEQQLSNVLAGIKRQLIDK